MKQENTKWQHITRTWPRGITPTQRITQQKQQSLTLNTTGRPAQRTLSSLGRVSSPTRLTSRDTLASGRFPVATVGLQILRCDTEIPLNDK